MKIIRLLTAGLALAAGATVALPAAGASAQVKPAAFRHIGSCRAHGDFAICTTGGSINRPAAVHVHVSATPGAHVTGAWDVVCSKGTGAASKSGSFSGHTTLTRKLRFPMRNPDNCDVSADAQRDGSGGIHVWLTGTTRSRTAVRASQPGLPVLGFTLLTKRGDSSDSGTDWALDNIARFITIRQVGTAGPGAWKFTAQLTDIGEFTTIPGAVTPADGTKRIRGQVTGPMHGSWSFVFTANAQPVQGLIPTFERGTPDPVTDPEQTTSLWFEQAFPGGTTFTGGGLNDWGWTYTGPTCITHTAGATRGEALRIVAQRWVDAAPQIGGESGNITGKC